MREFTDEEWADVHRKLAEPFDPALVQFRVADFSRAAPNARVEVLAYVDERAVGERLDRVVGPGNWCFDYEPLTIEKVALKKDKPAVTAIVLAKGILTIAGVSKSDVGEYSQISPSKGCVSDCFGRAAVKWGMGRELYRLGKLYADLDASKQLTAAEKNRIRKKYLTAPARDAQGQIAPQDYDEGYDEDSVVDADPGSGSAKEGQGRLPAPAAKAATATSSTIQQPPNHPPSRSFGDIKKWAMHWLTAEDFEEKRKQSVKGGKLEIDVLMGLLNSAYRRAFTPTSEETAATPAADAAAAAPSSDEPRETEQQRASIRKLCAALGLAEPDSMTYAQAREKIKELSRQYQERSRRAS